ncbi:uncharacterized protein LOC144168586 [Haemaphysalis longicornis]
MSAADLRALMDVADFDSSDSEDFTNSDEDDEVGEFVSMVSLLSKLARDERHRVPLYVESVVARYKDFEFKKLFRLSRATTEALDGEFSTSSFYPQGNRGRPKITAEKTVLLALTYIGTQSTLYRIADKFDVSESTVHAAITRVVGFLLEISAREIRWPNVDERERIKSSFLSLRRVPGGGLPDVVGAIDGCHIRISRPSESADSYFNRKKFYSIVIQDVCDGDLMFTDVFVGFPGSAHDARVLRESFFFQDAASKCEGGYLIGDAAYPLLPWLLPPYKQTTGNWQPRMSTFNTAHSRQRVAIERAFVLLKARFQRLLYVDVASIGFTVDIVLTACVLHNIAGRAADAMDEEDVDLDSVADTLSPGSPQEQETTGQAAALRDNIARSLESH